MKKLHFAILKSEFEDEHLQQWENACEERSDLISWEIIDLTRADWLKQIKSKNIDGLLALPPNITNAFKSLYDERVTILHEECGIPVFPFLGEIKVYENKKYLSYWLAAHNIPHPQTNVFYHKQEALNFLKDSPLPIVGKTNIGASGHGVSILKSRQQAIEYVNNTFSGKGSTRKVGPNWKKKGFAKRVFKKLLNPGAFKAKLKQYQHQNTEKQTEYVILQEFIAHTFEWRCVRIGDSFFAHKKMVMGEKASGSLIKGYENPPLELLDFVKEVTDLKHFRSQSVDIFTTQDGRYLVNEMQCTFGQSDPYQMLIDGTAGRYIIKDGEWLFEAGDFNRYECFLLRLDYFLETLVPSALRN
ncbi:MAG: hypothetical protein DHS20C18_09190 [Saprospiraceae bacterium]|nr:MAG: hypothetical protein DHS20C18_09190 [Saprospiraceae bacterium]